MSNNISINGSGRVNGGTYDSVTINGSGSIGGSLTCKTMTINGSGKVQGDLTTDGSFTINGSGVVEGNITGQGEISLNGSGKVGGSVHCHSFHTAGSGSVVGDCEGEEIRMEGGGSIGGLLNGEEIRLILHPHCHMRIGNIGGTNIVVEHKDNTGIGKPITLFGFQIGNHAEGKRNGILETDTIEGDTITLTCTQAKRVSGRIVKLGPGCQIDRVEYTETYEADETCTVGEVVKG